MGQGWDGKRKVRRSGAERGELVEEMCSEKAPCSSGNVFVLLLFLAGLYNIDENLSRAKIAGDGGAEGVARASRPWRIMGKMPMPRT